MMRRRSRTEIVCKSMLRCFPHCMNAIVGVSSIQSQLASAVDTSAATAYNKYTVYTVPSSGSFSLTALSSKVDRNLKNTVIHNCYIYVNCSKVNTICRKH